MREKLFIIKIGGTLIDDETELNEFLKQFASIKAAKILIHGGGKLATTLADKLSIPQQMIEGRRVTDKATLNIVTMVYAGSINKNIVAKLQQLNCNSIGLSGADANLIEATIRSKEDVDFGYVGDVSKEHVNVSVISRLLEADLTPVFSSVTHDHHGTLLNTNADSIASVVAEAMSEQFDTELLYCFDRDGVLEDVDNPDSVIKKICEKDFNELKSQNKLSKGILPKLENALKAKKAGVANVALINENKLQNHIENHHEGTVICL